MLDVLFVLINLIPLPFWFLMIFLPRRPITQRVMSNYLVFVVLGALYIFTLVGAVVAGISAARTSVNLVTAAGIATLLASPAAALVVWLHMLTMDLIGGHWLYHEAQRIHAPTLLTSICLLLTFLLGPLGLFTFVLWRALTHARKQAVSSAIVTSASGLEPTEPAVRQPAQPA